MFIYNICHLMKSYTNLDKNLEMKNINVIQDVSLEIKKGEVLAIIGKSGCGKTTLLKILGGMLKPTSGKVLYQNEDIYQYSNEKLEDYRRLSVGMVFQDYKLLTNLSIRENIMLPSILNHSDIDFTIDRTEKMARTLGIADKLDCYPYELSGGEKQRVAISRALMNDPSVILADEPTGNLDPRTTTEVIELLLEIKNAYKKTIIIVTHDMKIGDYCDSIVKMEQGKKVCEKISVKADFP